MCTCVPGFAVAQVAQHSATSTSSPSPPSTENTGPYDSTTSSGASTHTVTQSQSGNKHTLNHSTAPPLNHQNTSDTCRY